MFTAIAIHHPRPEHADEFLAFMKRVVDNVAGSDGLIEFRAWREVGESESPRLVGISTWESPEAFQAALPKIMELSPERRPEWSDAPDELLTLAPG